jgi:hypothetical protein
MPVQFRRSRIRTQGFASRQCRRRCDGGAVGVHQLLRCNISSRSDQHAAALKVKRAILPVPPDRAQDFPTLEICIGASTLRNRNIGLCQACPARWSGSDRNEGKRTIFLGRPWYDARFAQAAGDQQQVFVRYPRLAALALHCASTGRADEPARVGRAGGESQAKSSAPVAHAMPWAPCSPCRSWKLRPRTTTSPRLAKDRLTGRWQAQADAPNLPADTGRTVEEPRRVLPPPKKPDAAQP